MAAERRAKKPYQSGFYVRNEAQRTWYHRIAISLVLRLDWHTRQSMYQILYFFSSNFPMQQTSLWLIWNSVKWLERIKLNSTYLLSFRNKTHITIEWFIKNNSALPFTCDCLRISIQLLATDANALLSLKWTRQEQSDSCT